MNYSFKGLLSEPVSLHSLSWLMTLEIRNFIDKNVRDAAAAIHSNRNCLLVIEQGHWLCHIAISISKLTPGAIQCSSIFAASRTMDASLGIESFTVHGSDWVANRKFKYLISFSRNVICNFNLHFISTNEWGCFFFQHIWSQTTFMEMWLYFRRALIYIFFYVRLIYLPLFGIVVVLYFFQSWAKKNLTIIRSYYGAFKKLNVSQIQFGLQQGGEKRHEIVGSWRALFTWKAFFSS